MALESQSFYLSLADDGHGRSVTYYKSIKRFSLKNIFTSEKNLKNDRKQRSTRAISKSSWSSCWSKLKYSIMLLLICWLGMSCFVAMESAVPMEQQFMDAFNGNGTIEANATLTHNMFMDFTTFFSLPNIPGSFVGGFIVEAIGYRWATVIFMLTTIFGQAILTYGVYLTQMNVVLLGRCIFGLSCEIISISGYTYVYKWFSGPWFNLVFAIRVSTARVGASVVTLFGEKIYDLFLNNLKYPNFNTPKMALTAFYGVTTISVALGFLGACLMMFFLPDGEQSKVDNGDEKLIDDDNVSETSKNAILPESTSGGLTDKIWATLKICKLNIPAWLVILNSTLFYINIEAWLNQAKLMFVELHGADSDTSSTLTTMLSFVPIFACPVFGYLIDKVKGNAWWSFAGCLLSCLGHLIIAIPGINLRLVYTATVFLGLGYSMVGSCVWTLMSLSVDDKSKNISFGIMQACQHAGMIIGAKVAGAIVDSYYENIIVGYKLSEIFFLCCTFIAALLIMVYGIGYRIGPNGAVSKSQYEALKETDDEE